MGQVIDKAVAWAVDIANDNSHGYSQTVRWGPSYDCSSLVISAYDQAGIPVGQNGATYTGNMYSVFTACGFRDVTNSIVLATGKGCKKGDVLLNHASHTALCVNESQVVHARSSEGTTDTADNSGNEIRVQSYWNYPWDCVLRLPETEVTPDDTPEGITIVDPPEDVEAEEDDLSGAVSHLVRYGDNDVYVRSMQWLLKAHGYSLNADGEYGPITYANLTKFQLAHGLSADGVCGPKTWHKLTLD